jgi:ABC-type multidrug transport system permease subunit
MAAWRIALLTIRLVMRTKVALFFTFFFPVVFLFAYAGLFAHSNPQAVAYMFGPVVTLTIMGSGFWGLGLQSVMQRERGSLRRYRLAPIGAGTIVMSNLLANYLLGLPTIGLLVLCATLIFHMPFHISLLDLLILVTVGTFAFAGFGLTIASVANTMQEAQIYNNLVWLTLLFLSGTTVPLPLLPHWVQRLAAFLPATYLVSAFQGLMVQSQALSAHSLEMLALAVSGTFGLLFAWKLFRWEKEERIDPRAKAWSLSFVVPFLLMGLWMNTYASPTTSWATSYFLMAQGGEPSGTTPLSEPGNLIEGFDEPQASEEALKRWQVVTDTPLAGHSAVELSLVSPGAAGTEHALRFQGVLAAVPDGQPSVAARYQFTLPGGQTLHGFELWVRGDARVYQLRLFPAGLKSDTQPEAHLIPSQDWQSLRLPVHWDLSSAGGSSAGIPWVFEIVVSGAPGEFSIQVDQLESY